MKNIVFYNPSFDKQLTIDGCHGLAIADLQDGGVPSEDRKVAALFFYNAMALHFIYGNVCNEKQIYLRCNLKGHQHLKKTDH